MLLKTQSLLFIFLLIVNTSLSAQTASNGMYIEILPDTRVTHDDELIGAEDNGLHVGMDGKWPEYMKSPSACAKMVLNLMLSCLQLKNQKPFQNEKFQTKAHINSFSASSDPGDIFSLFFPGRKDKHIG